MDLQGVQQGRSCHRYHGRPAKEAKRLKRPAWISNSQGLKKCTAVLTAGPGAPGRPLSPGRPRAPYQHQGKPLLVPGLLDIAACWWPDGGTKTYHRSGDAVLTGDTSLSLGTERELRCCTLVCVGFGETDWCRVLCSSTLGPAGPLSPLAPSRPLNPCTQIQSASRGRQQQQAEFCHLKRSPPDSLCVP